MNEQHWKRVEAFRKQFWADVQADRGRSRDEYLALFAGLETEIDAEIENLNSAAGSRESLDRASTEALPRKAGALEFPRLDARIRSFRLIRELGRGGQGVVYLAEDERYGRKVALKTLSFGQALSPSARLRFEGEARAAARLSHPGIAQVHDSGEHEGVPYIVMEFVEGRPLSDLIRDRRRELDGDAALTSIFVDLEAAAEEMVTSIGSVANTTQVDEAATESKLPSSSSGGSPGSGGSGRHALRAIAEFIELTARALHVAHESGFIHRDLKPGNIMVRRNGNPCVLDFGLARDESTASDVASQAIVGTPAYMAPEQTRGDSAAIGRHTDVWALGATLYEISTLRRPFKASHREELYRIIRDEEPLSPRRINPDVDRDLEAIILTALDKDPDRRYTTAEELAEDLCRFRKREPIQARPAGWWLKTFRWAERRPALASLIAVVFLGLACATIWTSAKNRELDHSNTTLQETITQLEEKTRAEQRQRHGSLLRKAELEMKQGRYGEALETWTSAHALGLTPDAEFALQQARGKLGQLDYAGAQALLLDLDPDEVTGPLAARIRLLRGDLIPLEIGGNGWVDIKTALESGELPPADAAYARAILAKTTPEALVFVEEALEQDRDHIFARELRGLLIFLMGDAERLDQLADVHRVDFPGDLRASVFELLAALLRDDEDEKPRREELTKALRESVDERTFKNVLDLATVVTSLRRAERLFVLSTFASTKVARPAAFAYLLRQQATVDATARLNDAGWRALGIRNLSWTAVFSNVAKALAKAPRAKPEEMTSILQELRAAHKRVPNPVFLMLEGALALSKRRPDEAVTAARQLLKGPLNDGREPLAHGILTLGIYLKLGTPPAETPEEIHRLEFEWTRHAEWLVNYKQLSPDQHALWAEAASAVGDELLARRLAEAYVRRYPKDFRALLCKARVLAEFGSEERALSILEELVARKAKTKTNKTALAEARELLVQLGEATPDRRK